jgi:hypothetical protein
MDMVAALIGMILLATVFLIEELWMRIEPADPLHPDTLTNRFLEQRWRYECPCGKTIVTYDPYVLSYRCLSCRITLATRAVRLVLTCLGFSTPQPPCGENAATAVAVTTDVVEKY